MPLKPRKSKIKVSGKSALPGLQIADLSLCHHMVKKEGVGGERDLWESKRRVFSLGHSLIRKELSFYDLV